MDETETEELSKIDKHIIYSLFSGGQNVEIHSKLWKNYWKNCGSGWQRYRPTMVFLLFSVADVLFSSA